MSHGFTRISTDQLRFSGVHSLVMHSLAIGVKHSELTDKIDYLRATEVEVGLLLNFGVRPQFRRLLFDNERKNIRGNPCESVAKASA